MILKINDRTYEVDMSPLRERASIGMKAIVNSKGSENPLLKQMVKGACTFAMSILGITKSHRNDDPIELVTLHVANLVFDGIEEAGLTITGTEILPPKTAAVVEAIAEEAAEDAATD